MILEPPYSLEFSGHCWRSPELRAVWEQFIQARDNHDALYQTPKFFEHLHATVTLDDLSLLTVWTADRSLAGVVPLRVARWSLSFDLSGYLLGESILRAVVVLGSQPLIPSDPALHDRLFITIGDAFPDCDAIGMDSVPSDSFLWRHCHDSKAIRDHFLVHIPYGRQACHTIPLPATFEEYLGKLTAKKRYNLRRQVRLLRAFANGALDLRRIETPDEVPLLLESVSALRRVPPAPGDDLRLMDLARRGILLAYLLFCGERRCAVVMGLQHDSTYRLDEMAHDQSIAALSPGSTMLFLMIEDLIRHRIDLIDFGYGEPAYPYRSTNVPVRRGTILLLRKTFVNRLRRTGHWTFRTVITLIKHLLRIDSLSVSSLRFAKILSRSGVGVEARIGDFV